MKPQGIDLQALARSRANALLVVDLSRRNDLALQETGDVGGFDYLVRVMESGSLNTNRIFWADLKASVKETNGPRVELTREHADVYAESPVPVCLFFYAMNDDIGYFTWLSRPIVTASGKPDLIANPRLSTTGDGSVMLTQDDFTKVDSESLGRLVDCVNAWYDARHTHREAA